MVRDSEGLKATVLNLVTEYCLQPFLFSSYCYNLPLYSLQFLRVLFTDTLIFWDHTASVVDKLIN
jgi:hypothetical protein